MNHMLNQNFERELERDVKLVTIIQKIAFIIFGIVLHICIVHLKSSSNSLEISKEKEMLVSENLHTVPYSAPAILKKNLFGYDY